MSQRDFKPEALLLITVALAINASFLYGLLTRPVIAYHISTPLDYNATIDFDSDVLTVDLEVENKGLSSARLVFIARIYNMSLTGPEGIEIRRGEIYSEAVIPIEDAVHKDGHEAYTVELEGTPGTSHQILIFSVEGKPNTDPVTGFHDSFAIFEPVRPTALLLKRVGDGSYMRVRSR
jgi:hypothetical protein